MKPHNYVEGQKFCRLTDLTIDTIRHRSFVRGEFLGFYRCNFTELKSENMKTK